MLKAKAPNSKPQAPGKLQIPSSNVALHMHRCPFDARDLEFGAWCPGAWSLALEGSFRADPLKTAENTRQGLVNRCGGGEAFFKFFPSGGLGVAGVVNLSFA